MLSFDLKLGDQPPGPTLSPNDGEKGWGTRSETKGRATRLGWGFLLVQRKPPPNGNELSSGKGRPAADSVGEFLQA